MCVYFFKIPSLEFHIYPEIEIASGVASLLRYEMGNKKQVEWAILGNGIFCSAFAFK